MKTGNRYKSGTRRGGRVLLWLLLAALPLGLWGCEKEQNHSRPGGGSIEQFEASDTIILDF